MEAPRVASARIARDRMRRVQDTLRARRVIKPELVLRIPEPEEEVAGRSNPDRAKRLGTLLGEGRFPLDLAEEQSTAQPDGLSQLKIELYTPSEQGVA